MTNIRTNYGKEKGGKGLKNHFSKHKKLYVVGAGVIVGVVVKREYDKNILNVFRAGRKIECDQIWNDLLYEVRQGNLQMNVVGDIENNIIKKNVTKLKDIIQSEG